MTGQGLRRGQEPRAWATPGVSAARTRAEGEGGKPDQSWGAAQKWPFMLLPQRPVGPLKEIGFKADIHEFHLGSESL